MSERVPNAQQDNVNKRYPRYIKRSDGAFVPEDSTSASQGAVESPDVYQHRRGFLRLLAGGALAALSPKLLREEYARHDAEIPHYELRTLEERMAWQELYSLESQIERQGEVIDIGLMLEAHFYHHLDTLDPKRGNRIELMMKRLKDLEMNFWDFSQPFIKRGFPKTLPFLLAAQESDFRNNVSSRSEAVGVLGIKEIAAKDVGYVHTDAWDPVTASKIAARLFEKNRDRYVKQDDLDLLTHAYNSGWTLRDFCRKEQDPERRTLAGFYGYMEDRINTIIRTHSMRQQTTHMVVQGETLEHIAEQYDMSVDELAQTNKLTTRPATSTTLTVKKHIITPKGEEVLRPELEVLRYVPEIKAKFVALTEQGYMEHIRADIDDSVHWGTIQVAGSKK
ncbi:transglycosylase SLT domain-containing protein [Candidatus Kaiserbacteria bacterium]|nr:transglycosylase SLT domain-containing protein [Candidatus Kaiserbacteria bacterium]